MDAMQVKIEAEYFAGDQKSAVSPIDGYEYRAEELRLLRFEDCIGAEYLGEFEIVTEAVRKP